jgi:hypothetical protein
VGVHADVGIDRRPVQIDWSLLYRVKASATPTFMKAAYILADRPV